MFTRVVTNVTNVTPQLAPAGGANSQSSSLQTFTASADQGGIKVNQGESTQIKPNQAKNRALILSGPSEVIGDHPNPTGPIRGSLFFAQRPPAINHCRAGLSRHSQAAA